MVVFEKCSKLDVVVDCWSRVPYFQRSNILVEEGEFDWFEYYYLPKESSLTGLCIPHPSKSIYSKRWAEVFEDPE